MRRPDLPVLTSLRFPAAFAIVLLHYLPPAGWTPGLAAGVSFFYVLSGFILYYNYSDLTDRVSFWVARFARIWPVHAVTLVAALVMLPFVTLLGQKHWMITLPANILLIQTWIPFHGSALSYNGVAWSLSVEAFFYLTFPWLLKMLTRSGVLLVLTGTLALGAVVTATSILLIPQEPAVESFNPLCRLFEFALGMATCHIWFARKEPDALRKWTAAEIGVALAAIAFALLIRPALHAARLSWSLEDWVGNVTSACGFAGLIWVFAHQSGAISRAFSGPIFVRLGEISFATYMCHQIILRWLDLRFPAATPPHSWHVFALYIFLSLAVSYLLFTLVETPARHAIVGFYRSRRAPRTVQVVRPRPAKDRVA